MKRGWPKTVLLIALALVWVASAIVFTVGVIGWLTTPRTTPTSTAAVQLAAGNPAAIRPGTQVPLMRFKVTALSGDIVLNEIYFSFFYDAGGAKASAENFTLWNGPVLISSGENLNPQTVKFSQFSARIPADSSVAFEIRSDVTGPDGATMKMSLDQSRPTYLQGLPLDLSLNVLRPWGNFGPANNYAVADGALYLINLASWLTWFNKFSAKKVAEIKKQQEIAVKIMAEKK